METKPKGGVISAPIMTSHRAAQLRVLTYTFCKVKHGAWFPLISIVNCGQKVLLGSIFTQDKVQQSLSEQVTSSS